MTRDIKLYITDIIESISLIEEYTKNLTPAEFNNNQRVMDAVFRRLEIIGEAVKQMPQDFKVKYPEIPWRRIAGLRDVLTHEYFGIKIDRVWKILQTDLPELKKQIKKLLESLEEENVE